MKWSILIMSLFIDCSLLFFLSVVFFVFAWSCPSFPDLVSGGLFRSISCWLPSVRLGCESVRCRRADTGHRTASGSMEKPARRLLQLSAGRRGASRGMGTPGNSPGSTQSWGEQATRPRRRCTGVTRPDRTKGSRGRSSSKQSWITEKKSVKSVSQTCPMS